MTKKFVHTYSIIYEELLINVNVFFLTISFAFIYLCNYFCNKLDNLYLLLQAGYNTVDSASSFTIPAARVPELSTSSNINVTACWSFHVDGSPKRKPTTCIIV